MSRNAPRPLAPNLKISQSLGPTSPPQTPTSASPLLNRSKFSPKSSRQRTRPRNFSRPTSHAEHIRLHSNGPQLGGYTVPIRPEQLSPRSQSSSVGYESSGSEPRSSSHEDDDDEDEEDEEEEEESEVEQPPPSIHKIRITAVSSFTVEEMSDYDPFDSDNEGLNMRRPDAYEYADSDRSRSRSRNPPELPRGVMRGMRHLNCGPDSNSDEDIPDDDEHKEFARQQRELKLRKRLSHGSSMGKRTHSERGDSDRDDLESLDGNEESPSNTRRTRRKLERWSMQFTEANPILEVDEHGDDEIIVDGKILFRELPYYMEIDSC
jgi:hypothetical protein